MKILLLAPLALVAGLTIQEGWQPARPTEHHEWLQRLVGEWEVTFRSTMEPGAEPMVHEGTETFRPIGELWVVGEGRMEFGGMEVTSLMTLGHDSGFVGTWISSADAHLWRYEGRLEDDGRALVLEATGPSFEDPSKSAVYRDRIEWVDDDTRTFSSSVRGEGGEWTTFMTAEARRVE